MTEGTISSAKPGTDSSGELTIVNSPRSALGHRQRPRARIGEVLWVVWCLPRSRRELMSSPPFADDETEMMLIEFTQERPKKRRPLTGSRHWKSASGLSGLRGCRPY
ncbi:MAG: hypothetical protein ACRYFS_08110 [Janthinobacterium lividum]